MLYSIPIEIEGWYSAEERFVPVTVWFDVTVEDGSFSHDWTPGAVEKVTEYEVTDIHLVFHIKRCKRFVFKPYSGYAFVVDLDENTLELAKEAAIIQAIEMFEGRE